MYAIHITEAESKIDNSNSSVNINVDILIVFGSI